MANAREAHSVSAADIGRRVQITGQRASESEDRIYGGVLAGYRKNGLGGKVKLNINQGGHGRDIEVWVEPRSLVDIAGKEA